MPTIDAGQHQIEDAASQTCVSSRVKGGRRRFMDDLLALILR